MSRSRVAARRLVLDLAALSLVVGIAAGAARADAPDWTALAAPQTVEVITVDEDGDVRETTIWIVAVEGQAYIRTGNTSWGDNLVRTPELTLRANGVEHPLRVQFVEDDGLRRKIEHAFREKYGFSDWSIALFRGSRPKMMRLEPR
jgi:hypothetical protein